MEELKGGKKNICIGLLAHVDAGKTTLSEEMLHRTGVLEQAGRVDKGNAFLDTYELEIYYAGYSGTCGFFCRNGADIAGAGLWDSGDQCPGRCAGAYYDFVAAVEKT